jgi:hypothetical protein
MVAVPMLISVLAPHLSKKNGASNPFLAPHSGPKSQKPGHEGCSLVIRAVNSWFLMKSCT